MTAKKTAARRKTTRTTARRGATRPRAAAAAAGAASPIRHVVVLMLENRSFDHALGALQASLHDVDGIAPGTPRVNASKGGVAVPQVAGPPVHVEPDPNHDAKSVDRQIAKGAMDGFVTDYEAGPPVTTAAQWPAVMRYHAEGKLPALHALARAFTTCNRWFSSVPGPTWTNRLFAMSGTSKGIVDMPSGPFGLSKHDYDQPSVFRRLTEAKRSWRVYFGDFPLALLLKDMRTIAAGRRFSLMKHFEKDCAGPEASFPDFTFIEPSYLGQDANDDHPPTDMARGQALVARVYRALRSNEALWRSTLLVLTYDEHGGFYDHVKPPEAVPPDGHQEELAFDRLGVRVPCVLVSPWMGARRTNVVFDHASVLRLAQSLWGLGDLGRRVERSEDLSQLFLKAPRTDTPATIPAALAAPKLKARAAAAAAAAPARLNDHQRAIVALSESLEKDLKTAPAKRGLRAAALAEGGPQVQAAVAQERALEFLRKRGARL